MNHTLPFRESIIPGDTLVFNGKTYVFGDKPPEPPIVIDPVAFEAALDFYSIGKESTPHIALIKIIRRLTDLGLMECKDAVDLAREVFRANECHYAEANARYVEGPIWNGVHVEDP